MLRPRLLTTLHPPNRLLKHKRRITISTLNPLNTKFRGCHQRLPNRSPFTKTRNSRTPQSGLNRVNNRHLNRHTLKVHTRLPVSRHTPRHTLHITRITRHNRRRHSPNLIQPSLNHLNERLNRPSHIRHQVRVNGRQQLKIRLITRRSSRVTRKLK